MQKALLATTALVLSAGVAAADVTISGYGRTGIIYYENDSDVREDVRETQVSSRIRMNLDATTESDAGVEFGARLRLQHDQNGSRQSLPSGAHDGRDEIRTQAGKVWISAQGLTVEIGNVDTAFDGAGLLYATDLGSYDRSGAFAPSVDLSAMAGGFFTYTDSYVSRNRVGVAAKYSFGDLTVRASYVDPDQSDVDTGVVSDIIGNDEKELGISADYKWDDRLELSGAYTNNAGGWDGVDLFFVGARYAVLENARIGLNYVNADDYGVDVNGGDGGLSPSGADSFGQTFALYGDYTLADGLTNIEAYVANNDGEWAAKETDNAFGIGVNYDLGGARLGASIHRDYSKLVSVDAGVRFEF